MSRKRKVGPIARDVGALCSEFKIGKISEDEYKSRLSALIERHGKRYQSYGLAINKQVNYSDKKDIIWKLTDDVEPKIRAAVINWDEKTSKAYEKM